MSKKILAPLENLNKKLIKVRNRKFLTGFIFLIIFLAVFGFLFFNFRKIGKIEASPELKDVYGWAWSENIGWIRFRGKIPILDKTGLAAGYILNENTGTKIYDSSGNNNTGDLYNGPVWTPWNSEPYPYNTALQFDGVNDYAGVPDGPVSNLNITSAISLEAWIKGQAAGFTKTPRPGTANTKYSPQFQVVGDKTYYVWSEIDASGYYQIWTGEMNTDGTGWSANKRTKTTDTPSHKSTWLITPQLQVVGNKIHYVWVEKDADDGSWELWRAELDLGTNTWSIPNNPIRDIGNPDREIFVPQLQVVGNKIHYVWVETDAWGHPRINTGELNLATNAFTSTTHDSPMVVPLPPFPSTQLQVVGDKIYYIFPGQMFYTSLYGQIWTAKLDLATNIWTANERTSDIDSPFNKYYPQLQVVGDKIYYIWEGNGKIWTAKLDILTNNFSGPIERGSGTQPQLQVVGDKIYYVWQEGNKIYRAEMKTDGSEWQGPFEVTTGISFQVASNLQFQIVGSKSYFVWEYSNNIYIGEMNSNLINKGDFYGLGVKDGKVIGFINAGVDGFKYTGNATADTAGATVNLTLPDSNWHHLVATYDKTNLKLYLDGGTSAGGQEASVPYSANINTNPFPLIIGDDFNGTIDEIRIYNKALNATEVKAHFEGTTYGVSVDSGTGIFSGYAWSEHIGWIRFDPPGPYPIDPQYSARVDLTSTGTVCGGAGWVCGWARALVDGGGWDGWIKLGPIIFDSTNHGVWLDTTAQEFRGWAWGSDVIGWISFNCKEGGYNEGTGEIYNICSISNYQVKTSLSLNFKPTASNLSLSSEYCDINPGVGQVSFSWLYEDQEGSPQSHYHLEIATISDFSNKVVDCVISQTVASGSYGSAGVQVISNAPVEDCTLPLQISYGSPYYWRISVKDGLQWSDPPVEGPSFTTPLHAKPWVDFTWCPLTDIAVYDDIQFCSTEQTGVCESGAVCEAGATRTLPDPTTVPPTTCYDTVGNEVPCTTWTWDFQDANLIDPSPPPPVTTPNAQIEYSSEGIRTVTLTVCDSTPGPEGPYCCPKSREVNVAIKLSLPQWKEIPPTF